MDDEAEFLITTSLVLECGQFLPDPLGDSTVAVDLRLPVALEELGRVRRLVGVGRVVEVEFGIAAGRIGLVEDGCVQPFGERAVSADMRGEQHDAVGRRQIKGFGLLTGLLLVIERQRSTATPAGQHHLRIAQAVLGVVEDLAEILDDLLHQQIGVGAAIPAAGVDDVVPGAGEGVNHRKVGAAADRVHEDKHGIASRLWLELIALQHHQLGDPAVDVPYARIILVGNQIGNAFVSAAHECWPKSAASTSADGIRRCRVSMAITFQSTRE